VVGVGARASAGGGVPALAPQKSASGDEPLRQEHAGRVAEPGAGGGVGDGGGRVVERACCALDAEPMDHRAERCELVVGERRPVPTAGERTSIAVRRRSERGGR
jgi:hypothetical protein